MPKGIRQILFDHEIFRRQNFGGISRYFTEIISGINHTTGYKALPPKFCSSNVYLKEHGLAQFYNAAAGDSLFKKVLWKFENRQLYNRLRKGSFDVFHPTYYGTYFLELLTGKPFVITVHDMIHENYLDSRNEYHGEETKGKLALLSKAAHIIAVSNYTKKQIIRHFPDIDQDKISVVYHGVNIQRGIAFNAEIPGLPEKYLLFIGTKKHYKNFFWLVESVRDYLKSTDIKLVCAGGFDFDGFELDFLANLGLLNHVQHVPFNTTAELAAIYNRAVCFIFPSLEEGFGMPILEAFACNCPALLSNSSCFPEIAGDAALYFEPGNKEDLIEKIETLRTDKHLRSELIQKGKVRVADFDWAKTVAAHIEIYNKLLGK